MTNQAQRFYIEEKDRQHMKSFLTDLGFLPYQNWLSIEMDHLKGTEKTSETKICQIVQRQIGYKMTKQDKGIYIYEHEDGRIMYIGEGKLAKRISDHYNEVSFPTPKKKNMRFHHYFNKRQGKVRVYFKPTGKNHRPYRVAMEAFLIYVLQPEFLPKQFEKFS